GAGGFGPSARAQTAYRPLPATTAATNPTTHERFILNSSLIWREGEGRRRVAARGGRLSESAGRCKAGSGRAVDCLGCARDQRLPVRLPTRLPTHIGVG